MHSRLIEEAGGDINGTTSLDRTNFYDVVPINELETALWLESDRMGFLLPALTQAKLDGQRDVVKNERRERFEQPPSASTDSILSAAIYPAGHPYSGRRSARWPTSPPRSLDDVKEFFQRTTAPTTRRSRSSATLTSPATRTLVEKYFGRDSRRSGGAAAAGRPVTLAAEKRLVSRTRSRGCPSFTIAWPTVGSVAATLARLRALSQVLTRDRNSRLTRALVYDRQLATTSGVCRAAMSRRGSSTSR